MGVFQDDQQEWEEWTLENSVVLNWLKNPDYGFSDESSNDDLAADDVQHALEATWEKIEEQKEIKRRNQFLNF
jgi:ABC-type transport system substrate-binding protein